MSVMILKHRFQAGFFSSRFITASLTVPENQGIVVETKSITDDWQAKVMIPFHSLVTLRVTRTFFFPKKKDGDDAEIDSVSDVTIEGCPKYLNVKGSDGTNNVFSIPEEITNLRLRCRGFNGVNFVLEQNSYEDYFITLSVSGILLSAHSEQFLLFI